MPPKPNTLRPTLRLPTSFTWLNVTQFLGALNDNIFKLLLIFLLTSILGAEHGATIITTASALFVLPFILFSNVAGVLADRVSKSRIIVATKAMEIVIMGAGCVAVMASSTTAMYTILFLMCLQSTLFGPAKYGILPEMVPTELLSRANGLLVGLTYLAIIIGTFLPSFVLETLNQSLMGLAWCCLAVAIAGFFASLGIAHTPPSGSTTRLSPLFVLEIYRTLRSVRHDRYLLYSVFGAAYFLLLGGFIQQNILLFGQQHLGLNVIQSGFLFPLAAFGIGLGAVVAGRISGRNIEFGIVPVGAIGLALCCMLLGLLTPSVALTRTLIFFVGFFSGVFIVPLDAFIQHRSPPQQRGQVVAAQNFLSFLGVAISSVILALLVKAGASPQVSFLVIGLLTAILAISAGRILPDFLVRFVGVIITRVLYRIRISGVEHIPLEGGALLVPNHVTWVDSLLLSVLTQRRIRFVMLREILEQHWLRPVFRLMGAIPISMHDPPRRIVQALQQARAALDEGYLVCIFAEGALTRNGNLRAFRPGLERIVRGSAHPIIPIYIGGAWGSIFSHYYGPLMSAWPRRIPYPVWIAVGAPLPPETPVHAVRQAVLEASVTAYDLRKEPSRNLAVAFVHSARRHWRRTAITDSSGKRLSFGRTLAGGIALARLLEPRLRGQEHVGILLPASVGGALANIAVSLTGRVSVNLNFTASREALAHALAQSQIRTVLSARAFLEKMPALEAPPGIVYLEDLLPQIGTGRRLAALALAALAPARALMTHRRSGPDDLATIIFSSGSTGQPKGVMLTHHNILSNIESFGSVFGFTHEDRMCAALPLFHSFGFTTTLWCPLILGFSPCFHPNPLDATGIAALVRRERLTVLLATPTFLLGYLRRATREDFASLRCAVTGAEKLKARLADAFLERFGIRPQEGYGTTELSPAVGVSLPDVTHDGVTQVGSKPGSIGHPIPGVAIRIVDPDTRQPLAPGQEGLVLVKGPNVMRGYLNEPALTAEAVEDGWYNTGDIGRLDEDGFLFLVDRLARFSKIGGEMVPHVLIEERLMESVHPPMGSLAVTSIPDDRKGEQLVVLYTAEAGDVGRMRDAVRQSDLPNLWKPRDDCFMRIDSLPMLGSGKLDLRGIRDLAKRQAAERTGTE